MEQQQRKIGAILRNINHRWFNRLSKEKQAEINKLFQEYKKNYKEKIKNPFEMFSEDELPKYHQISFYEILNKEQELFDNEEYKKYILERRKKQYKKFNVEFVDDLDTGIELAFTDLQVYDIKKEKKDKFNRAKENSRKNIEKGMLEWEDR